MSTLKRREFMQRMAGWGAASALATRVSAKTDQGSRVRLGGPVFLSDSDPEALAREHRRLGYAAAYCPKVSLDDAAGIAAVSRAFRREGVVIAEVGRWVNLMDADPERRAEHLKTVTEGLALAEEVGALCCVDIAGSRNKEVWYGPNPENLSEGFFDEAVENARKILDAVKPQRARFCYEMMGWAIPDSVDSCLRLIRAVDRPGFGAHLDPCNLINSPEKFYGNRALLEECFAKLGPLIVSCHAKDLRWEVEMNVHFREVVPGTGSLDYATYLRLLSTMPQQPPLMMEHLSTAAEYDAARGYILEEGRKAGVTFA